MLHHCLGGQGLQVVELCEAVHVGGGHVGGCWARASHTMQVGVGQGTVGCPLQVKMLGVK